MKIGVVMPIGRDERSPEIPGWSTIRAAAHAADALVPESGNPCRYAPIPSIAPLATEP